MQNTLHPFKTLVPLLYFSEIFSSVKHLRLQRKKTQLCSYGITDGLSLPKVTHLEELLSSAGFLISVTCNSVLSLHQNCWKLCGIAIGYQTLFCCFFPKEKLLTNLKNRRKYKWIRRHRNVRAYAISPIKTQESYVFWTASSCLSKVQHVQIKLTISPWRNL